MNKSIASRPCVFLYLSAAMLLPLLLLTSCSDGGDDFDSEVVIDEMGYPSVVYHNHNYYVTGQRNGTDIIYLYSTPELIGENKHLKRQTILKGHEHGFQRFYSPELEYINGKWYIYFDSDNGLNSDTHQLYVMENPSEDPMKGTWTIHGPIMTNREWNFSIHPDLFTCGGKLYMLWSGWLTRRIESETQCIFIAEMENPWTLKSERILISQPEFEWERQWINSDGTRSAYPIFVNENPQAAVSPDGRNVVVFYSASGIWTEYIAPGMLYASATSNLLDPRSWTKLPEPLINPVEEDSGERISNLIVVQNTDDGECYLVSERRVRDINKLFSRWIIAAPMTWNDRSLPEI